MSDGLLLVILLAIALSILGAAGRGTTTRGVETKTVRYSATTIDDTQRRYYADAALFTRTGWAVHSVAWDPQAQRPTLVATYARYVEESLPLEFALWLPRSLARFRRYAAAILTAIAVPVITSVLLQATGVSGKVGTVAMLSTVVIGIAIGVHSEHLGSGPDKWLGWSVVIVGAVLGLLAVLVFVVFIALFGSLLGLYTTAAFGAWLVLRLLIAVVQMITSRRQRPA